MVATQIEVPGTGGGQTHVRELIEHLREYGEVLVLARHGSWGEGVVPVGAWPGLPPRGFAHVISAFNLIRSLPSVRAFAPNVIYERGSSFGLGAVYSQILGVPMLTMLLDEHISPLSLRRAKFVITTDPSLAPENVRGKAVKVSWGANVGRFCPGLDGSIARARYGFEPDDYVVGYCGTFQRWHGLDILLDVAEQTRATPSMKFMLIGEHRRAADLMRQVERRQLSARFVFTDRVPYEMVPGTLAATDVCVAPFVTRRHRGMGDGSRYSLDPLKVFEYLALEKPVVTTAVASVADLFRDYDHLRMVPEGDSDAFTQVLLRLRADPEAAQSMARAGGAIVRERHTWHAHAAQLAELFQRMLDEAPVGQL